MGLPRLWLNAPTLPKSVRSWYGAMQKLETARPTLVEIAEPNALLVITLMLWD